MTTPTTSLSDARVFFLTFGGSGFLRPASGTWGTLAAMPFAILLHLYMGGMGLMIAAAFLYIAAIPCLHWYERTTGTHDSSRIVIDEVIGIFLTLAVALPTIIDFVAGFFLFRAFDALKPGAIGWLDQKIGGPHGVLLDDVAAGILSAACLILIHYLGGIGDVSPNVHTDYIVSFSWPW